MEKTWGIKWYNELKSTVLTAQEALDHCDNMAVTAALSQTQGRGQGNHEWHSAPGENLTFSIVLKYAEGRFPAVTEKKVSDHTARSVVKYLASRGIEARIKLPNDIYVSDRKICGILIRHRISGSNLSGSSIGVGINVNQKSFPECLPNPVSMSMLTGMEYQLEKELKAFLEIFSENLEELYVEGI